MPSQFFAMLFIQYPILNYQVLVILKADSFKVVIIVSEWSVKYERLGNPPVPDN